MEQKRRPWKSKHKFQLTDSVVSNRICKMQIKVFFSKLLRKKKVSKREMQLNVGPGTCHLTLGTLRAPIKEERQAYSTWACKIEGGIVIAQIFTT
jgi:hypothetical protein